MQIRLPAKATAKSWNGLKVTAEQVSSALPEHSVRPKSKVERVKH